MIAQLFALKHSSEVRGLVLVDSASVYLKDTFTPAQWTTWMRMNQPTATAPDSEVPDYAASVTELTTAEKDTAKPLPLIPAAVLSSDQPWDLPLGGGSTWPAWLKAQADLAASLHAQHISKTDSGHGIQYAQPKLVTDAIRDVIDRVSQEKH